jgi:hypothetical protein
VHKEIQIVKKEKRKEKKKTKKRGIDKLDL